MSRRIKAFSEPIIPMKEISTNEQKAKEIAENWYSDFDEVNSYEECFESAITMAQWKDEQHKQEKQQWIDKAAEWFSYRFPNMSKEALEKFKEDMKGE